MSCSRVYRSADRHCPRQASLLSSRTSKDFGSYLCGSCRVLVFTSLPSLSVAVAVVMSMTALHNYC
eukprot:2881139-Karenia_brevis.AAC.1